MAVNKLLTSVKLAIGDVISAAIEVQSTGGTAANLTLQVVFLDVSDVVLVTDGIALGTVAPVLDSVDASGPWYRSVINNLVIPAGAIKINVGFAYDSLSISTASVSGQRPVLNRGSKVAPFIRPSNDSTDGGSGISVISSGLGISTTAISITETEVAVTNPIFIGAEPGSPADGYVWMDTVNSVVLDAATLEGQDSAYHLDWANFTGKPTLVSQPEAEAGVISTERMWSPLRVAQAIAALETGGTTHYIQSATPSSPVDGEIWFDLGNTATIDATEVVVDASAFSDNLSATDTDAQTAFDTLDAMTVGGLDATADETISGNWDFTQPITFGASKLLQVSTTVMAVRSAANTDVILEWQTSNTASHGAIGFNSSNVFEVYDQASSVHLDKTPTSGWLNNYGTGVASANIGGFRIYDSAGTSNAHFGYASASDAHVELKNNVAGDLEISTSNGTVRLFKNSNEKLFVNDFGVSVIGVLDATGGDSDDWNDSFGWGDHALAGYGSGTGTVTSVSGTAPVSVATGTTTPVISMAAATNSVNGYITSTDWNTFNGKVSNVSTNLVYTAGTRILSSDGNSVTLPVVVAAGNAGLMIGTDKTKLNGIATSANNYSLPQATATVRGGVELFSNTDNPTAANSVTSTASRTYGIQLNASNQMVVNVPWVNSSYTHPLHAVTDINTTAAQVIDIIDTNGEGHIVAMSTRTLTPGDIAAATSGHTHTTITPVDESADTACNVAFFNSATGNQAIKTGTNLVFNSNTGRLTATQLNATSDIRLKEVLPFLLPFGPLSTIRFNWKDGVSGRNHYGYSAQAVRKVMPQAVGKDSEGILSVNYAMIHTVKIAKLELEIAQLKNAMNKLATR